MKVFQKGFNYSQDGQGNRLVYHLQGCNMKCPWCANPEGMKVEGTLVEDRQWLIPSICPHGAISKEKVNRSLCENCRERECVTLHHTKGMYLSYTEISPEQILEEAQANEMMFYDGGGVTFTGGEATVQFGELLTVLQGLKREGIHTALETNGSHPRLPELFPYIGQLIMDCKHCGPEAHRQYTGISLEPVEKNIRLAAANHPRLHIRVPLIGGVNDSAEDRNAFIRFFQEIKGANVSFEVLAYHEFGKKKWEECGWDYQMTKAAYVDNAVLQSFRQAITEAGCTYQKT